MKNSLTLLALTLVLTALPASAQTYHYGYGSSRVVNQNQTGLYMPSSTYIGAGTMSKSARGLSTGEGTNNLPAVRMGAHVWTPGDNQYTDVTQEARHRPLPPGTPPEYATIYSGMPRQSGGRPYYRQPRYYYNNPYRDMHYYVPGQAGSYNSGSYGGLATYK